MCVCVCVWVWVCGCVGVCVCGCVGGCCVCVGVHVGVVWVGVKFSCFTVCPFILCELRIHAHGRLKSGGV